MSAIRLLGFTQTIQNLRNIRQGWGANVTWVVGVGAEYGAYLEFGTSRMPAYPYLFPAARDVMNTRFREKEKQAANTNEPMKALIMLLATEIEAQAKKNVTLGGSRSPGVHPQHPKVVTDNLRSSITAFPKGSVI